MTTNPNRTPAGVRTGGQFEHAPHAETQVALTTRAQGLTLGAGGFVDTTGLADDQVQWASQVNNLVAVRKEASAADGGSSEHHSALLREAIVVRGLAVMREPDLAHEPHLASEAMSDASGRLLRSSNAEIAELDVPRPLTTEERGAAVRLFARQVATEQRSSYGAVDTGLACLDQAASIAIGDRPGAVTDLRQSLADRAFERAGARTSITEYDVIAVANAVRTGKGMEPLT